MKQGETFLPQDFALTATTLKWLDEKFPSVDIDETMEIFVDKAAARGWSYRDWQAAFRNYVRNGGTYGGVVYRKGKAADPRWEPILGEARPYGFRSPLDHETPASYRTAFEQWKTGQRRAPVANIGSVLKRVSG